jgi:hypothetical protein
MVGAFGGGIGHVRACNGVLGGYTICEEVGDMSTGVYGAK